MAAELTPEQRDAAHWLGRMELRVVLPLKWAMLAISVVFWMWSRSWEAPGAEPFGLFFLYGAITASLTYFLVLDRITPTQVRPAVLISYVSDLGFVFLLSTFDVLFPGRAGGVAAGELDFSVLFMLMVLRGFALFRTRRENILAAVVITAMMLASMWLRLRDVSLLHFQGELLRLAMLWAVTFLSIVVVDLLNRQREEMMATRERLVRSESLASLGELAAGVAHEINNPIGVIGTYCEYLKRLPDNPNAEEIESIHREVKRCEAIVRQMMDFAQPRLEAFGPVAVGTLLEELATFMRLDREGAPVIEVSVEPGLPDVQGDRAQLKQAFLNILLNAKQALADRVRFPNPRVEVMAERSRGPRGPVRVTIRDNGPGIAREDTERAFEPFFTRKAGGTGLGLAVTRRIVDAHSGRIAIGPAEEGGTVVTIVLPRAGEEAP